MVRQQLHHGGALGLTHVLRVLWIIMSGNPKAAPVAGLAPSDCKVNNVTPQRGPAVARPVRYVLRAPVLVHMRLEIC